MNLLMFYIEKKMVVLGYAWAEDKEHCEENGRMLNADSSKVSMRARKRGLPQVNLLFMKNYDVFFILIYVYISLEH